MEDKTLKNKAIDIHGKKYVMVKDRLEYFNSTYPNGSIDTGIESDNGKEIIFSNNHSDVTNIIREKYIKRTEGYDFNKKIPIYYYSITKKGEEFIPFACECLGIIIMGDKG